MASDTVSMDKAGRVVLPKAVRERLHLRAGALLELEVREGHLELRPVEGRPALVKRDGWWIHQGTGAPADSLENAVERQRADRLRQLAR